jgi:hypothetical protein
MTNLLFCTSIRETREPNSSSDIGIRGWIAAGAMIVIGLVAWLMK